MALTTLTSKNQLTVPVAIVRRLNLKPGAKLSVSVEDQTIKIEQKGDPVDRLAGSLKTPPHLKGVPVEDIIQMARDKRGWEVT